MYLYGKDFCIKSTDICLQVIPGFSACNIGYPQVCLLNTDFGSSQTGIE